MELNNINVDNTIVMATIDDRRWTTFENDNVLRNSTIFLFP